MFQNKHFYFQHTHNAVNDFINVLTVENPNEQINLIEDMLYSNMSQILNSRDNPFINHQQTRRVTHPQLLSQIQMTPPTSTNRNITPTLTCNNTPPTSVCDNITPTSTCNNTPISACNNIPSTSTCNNNMSPTSACNNIPITSNIEDTLFDIQEEINAEDVFISDDSFRFSPPPQQLIDLTKPSTSHTDKVSPSACNNIQSASNIDYGLFNIKEEINAREIFIGDDSSRVRELVKDCPSPPLPQLIDLTATSTSHSDKATSINSPSTSNTQSICNIKKEVQIDEQFIKDIPNIRELI
ncbi:unnamed protein product, partial [Rotaria socialis]